MHVVVVDTGFANYHSVLKAVEAAASASSCAIRLERSNDPDVIHGADKLVMPGQGGFKDCAAAFAGGLGQAVSERVRRGTPFFGICLGLQVLFDTSEEAPGVRGLSLFAGAVRHLETSPGLKIPHMGWNRWEAGAALGALGWAKAAAGEWFYFDHSYHAVPEDQELVLGSVSYGPNRVTAAVGRDNVFATQFHPEKSQAAGLKLLSEFIKL